MSDAAALEALTAEIAELRATIKGRKADRHDFRQLACARVTRDELAAIDLAAAAKGVSRSELIRMGLVAVAGVVLPPRQPTPTGLVGRRRRKSMHFHDDRQPRPEIDRAALTREAQRLGDLRRGILADLGASTDTLPPPSERLSEAQGARAVPKLSR